MNSYKDKKLSVVLIGAGIMSATLAVLLRKLMPKCHILVLERLPTIASESSDAMNNAGTGHSAFCELNYTSQKEDGSINIKKAIHIASSFELSREFWCYLLQEDYLIQASSFIHPLPHISFVWGEENVAFLKKRYDAMRRHPLFDEMEFTTSRAEMAKWMPLVIMERDKAQRVAATKMHYGTDVNFGALTRSIFDTMVKRSELEILLNEEVIDLKKNSDGSWKIRHENKDSGEDRQLEADFVFVGAGGGALTLLDKSDIDEISGYGGFPISGQWLVCKNEKVIQLHEAKVYGKASVGAPPMSVPHLDTRYIDGRKALMFGPFAGFSTKFLKNGSYWDLPLSIELDNLIPMVSAGMQNLELTKYLIQQISQSPEDRIKALKEYMPSAELSDWELAVAGQRVQVIKKDEHEGGILEFGTEIIASEDGSIAGLLGASPGASTAVVAMMEVLKKCFPEWYDSKEWRNGLQRMMPSVHSDFSDENVVRDSRDRTSRLLFGERNDE